jgi:acetylornithine deacetylase
MNAPAAATAVSPQLTAMPLIRTLIGFDTTSRESNLALIDWVREYLAGYDVEVALTFDD